MGGREGKSSKKLSFFFFRGKRHDNKLLKVQLLLSRSFVVIAQAPKIAIVSGPRMLAISLPSKVANERRFSLRLNGKKKLIPSAGMPTMRPSLP